MFISIYSKAVRAATLTAIVVFAAPAQAASATTFVSGAGANTGTCALPSTPCRTFAYALAQTSPGGEIRALDSANYSPVTIGKSVTITGVDGAGILRVNAGDAITVSGAAGRVLIQNLSFDGFGAATNAINVTNAAVVEIVNCSIRRFAGNGVIVRHASGTAEVFITGLLASNNTGAGVYLAPTGTGAINARLADIRLDNNSANGLYVDGGGDIGRRPGDSYGRLGVREHQQRVRGVSDQRATAAHIPVPGQRRRRRKWDRTCF